MLWPVGTVYVSLDSAFNPNTTWGGTWVKIESGRFIEATETGTDVAGNKDAGLPNITGGYTTTRSADGLGGITGAFTGTTRTGATRPSYEYGAGDLIITFNASNSNSIYGNSDTVQPKSIMAFIWKRTA